MPRIAKRSKGFTLIEAMITVALLGVFTAGLYQMFKNGIIIFNSTMAKFALETEARQTMAFVTKAIQSCAGASVQISSLDSQNPPNSSFSAVLVEPVYTTDSTGGGCGRRVSYSTYMSHPGPNEVASIYQDHNMLYYGYTTQTAAALTLSTHLDSIMFVYNSNAENTTVEVGARFVRVYMWNKPPMAVYMKKTVVVKHLYAAGSYGS